jgi:ribonuclease Z
LPQVTFLGVSDATYLEGVNTAVLYAGQATVLVDCGPSVPRQLLGTLDNPEALDAIWITHQHADHCFGLPTLLLSLRLARRQKQLTLMGGPGSFRFLRKLLELGYPGSFGPEKCFAIEFAEVEPGTTFERFGLKLSAARTQHRVDCHSLRIQDNESRTCISGDGKVTPETLQLFRRADLVVHECQWVARASEDHSSVADLQPLFDEASISRLALVHCNNDERPAIANEVAKRFSEHAWLPLAGEICDV